MNCLHRERARSYVLGSLIPDDEAEFEAHLVACPSCTADVERLESSLARLEEDARQGADLAAGSWARAWESLAASILAPVPALVYVVVLIVAGSWLVTARPWRTDARMPIDVAVADTQSPLLLATAIPLHEDLVFRGAEGAVVTPAEVQRPPSGPLLFELHTGWAADERLDALRIELHLEGAPVWSAPVPPSSFDEVRTLRVVLDPAPLEEGVHSFVLVSGDGTGGDDGERFRTSFALRR